MRGGFFTKFDTLAHGVASPAPLWTTDYIKLKLMSISFNKTLQVF